MAEGRVPGPTGLQYDFASNTTTNPPGTIGASFVTPGPIGTEDEAEPLAARTVTQVNKDWDPTPQTDTSDITIAATDLADLATKILARGEAGEGGGSLTTDGVPVGTSVSVTIQLHGKFVNRIVKWDGYDKASAAAKKHWDEVLIHLKKHEQRHFDIALEEANALATSLVGHVVGSKPTLVEKVDAANAKIKKRQDDLDSPAESDHGTKKGHTYGNVIIDVSIK
jgi:Bacterial protein of unknown function (DUF922)